MKIKSLLLIIASISLTACGQVAEIPAKPIEQIPEPTIIKEEINKLAMIDRIEVLELESLPVKYTVNVKGNLRNGCEFLEPEAVRLTNKTYFIDLKVGNKGEMCTQALVPFEKNIFLATDRLEKGKYTVRVNELETEFELK